MAPPSCRAAPLLARRARLAPDGTIANVAGRRRGSPATAGLPPVAQLTTPATSLLSDGSCSSPTRSTTASCASHRRRQQPSPATRRGRRDHGGPAATRSSTAARRDRARPRRLPHRGHAQHCIRRGAPDGEIGGRRDHARAPRRRRPSRARPARRPARHRRRPTAASTSPTRATTASAACRPTASSRPSPAPRGLQRRRRAGTRRSSTPRATSRSPDGSSSSPTPATAASAAWRRTARSAPSPARPGPRRRRRPRARAQLAPTSVAAAPQRRVPGRGHREQPRPSRHAARRDLHRRRHDPGARRGDGGLAKDAQLPARRRHARARRRLPRRRHGQRARARRHRRRSGPAGGHRAAGSASCPVGGDGDGEPPARRAFLPLREEDLVPLDLRRGRHLRPPGRSSTAGGLRPQAQQTAGRRAKAPSTSVGHPARGVVCRATLLCGLPCVRSPWGRSAARVDRGGQAEGEALLKKR